MTFEHAVEDWKSNDEWRFADTEAAWKFFYHAAIQHYKDSALKEVGEPVGYLRTTEKALVFMPLTHVKDGEYFFTESQLIAAVAKKDEEIEHLRMALADTEALEAGTAETNQKLREQLATAEQRVAEACAAYVEPSGEHKAEPNSYIGGVDGLELLTNISEAIRSGEYRKYMKEV